MEIDAKYRKRLGQLNRPTLQHSVNVAELCYYIAEKMDVDKNIAYKIGYLHDIGKIYTPPRILKKNCSLLPIEREIVDLHAWIGYRMLKEEFNEEALVYLPVLYHHGFDKCKLYTVNEPVNDNRIMVFQSIVHTADIFDARLSKRTYHEGISPEAIIKDLYKDGLCDRNIINIIAEKYAV